MSITLRNNPAYKEAYKAKDGTIFYEPASDTGYHQSRHVAATAMNMYAAAGITPDLLVKILDEMEKAVNDNKLSSVAVWINNLRYRTRYPVDEDAAVRMAMIYYFIEGENPDKPEPHWTEKKLQLVKEDPAAYSFFMNVGIASIPTYSASPEASSPASLIARREALQALTPRQ